MKRKLSILLVIVLCCTEVFSQGLTNNCSINIFPNDTIYYNNQAENIVFSLDSVPNYSIAWSGDNLDVTDSLHPTTTLQVGETKTYSVEVVYENPNNLITNGDFSAGNTGFTSQLSYISYTGTQALCYEGTYSVGTNPHNYHQNWVNATHDGNMLIVNGATSPGIVVYQTTINNIQPHTNYAVKFEAANIDNMATNSNIARFQFSIDGQMVENIFPISTNIFQWDKYYQIWNSGNNSTATITIVNQNTSGGGNDFAIDNIEVHELCYATDTVVLQNISYLYDTIDASICSGDSFIFINNIALYDEGTYTDTIYTEGRDTIRTLNLSYYPNYHDTLQVSICDNETYDFLGSVLNATGEYIDTLHTINGCDSIITLLLNVNPTYNDTIFAEICDDTSYTDFNFNEQYTGIYTNFLQSIDGCDSLSTLSLVVNPTFLDSLDCQIYKGHRFTLYGFDESESGIYSKTFQTEYGCDSTYVINLTVIELKFPNVITANGDGINDVFEIYNLLEQRIFDETELHIYSRYGKKVYSKKNIQKREDFWDPAATNTSAGTFFYRFYAKGKEKSFEFSGTIEVLR